MATTIDPDKIPYVTCYDGFGTPWPTAVDLWGIRYDANTMLGLAAAVKQGGQDTVNAWAKINTGYTGPDAEVVYNAMAPVGPDTETIASNLQEMCAALGRFADDVEPVLASLTTIYSDEAVALKVDIGNFRPYVSHQSRRTGEQLLWGIPFLSEVFDIFGNMIGYRIEAWDQDTDLVRRNNDLIARVTANVAAYQQAERDCANRINALFSGTQYVPWSASMGTADLPGNVYGYGTDSLPTTGLPWGDPVDRVDSGQTKGVRFLTNMSDALGAAAGQTIATTLLLPMSVSGGMGAEEQKQTVVGIYNLLVAIGGNEDTPVVLYDPVTGQVTTQTRVEYQIELGKSMIGWDQWSTDPGTAAGTALFNVGSLIIPFAVPAKAGSAARAASAVEEASAASRAAATVRAAEEAAAAQRAAATARTVDTAADATRTAVVAGDTARAVDIVGDAARAADGVGAATTTRTVDMISDTATTTRAVIAGDAAGTTRTADTVSDLTSPEHLPHPANVVDDPNVVDTATRTVKHGEGGVIPPELSEALMRRAEGILPDSQLWGFSQVHDAGQVSSQLDTLEALLNKYPDQRGKIKALGYADLERSGDVAVWTDGTLIFNRGFINEMSGKPPDGVDPMVYLVNHEFGHIMAEGTGVRGQYREYLQSQAGDRTRRALVKMNLKGEISEYALQSWSEALAEGFAKVELSPLTATDAERVAHGLLVGKE